MLLKLLAIIRQLLSLTRLVAWTRRHYRAVIGAALGLSALAGAGVLRLQVDASFEELYGEDSRVVRWVRFVSDRLRRPDTLEIELALPGDVELAARLLTEPTEH